MKVRELIDELMDVDSELDVKVADLDGWMYDLMVWENEDVEPKIITLEPLRDTKSGS